VIARAPKILPFVPAMVANIAADLGSIRRRSTSRARPPRSSASPAAARASRPRRWRCWRGWMAEACRRLFLALWPGEAVAGALDAAGLAAQRLCGGRRMRRDTLHLTLAFLGDVEVALPGSWRPSARLGARPSGCSWTLGYWRHNHIVWAGCAERPAALDGWFKRCVCASPRWICPWQKPASCPTSPCCARLPWPGPACLRADRLAGGRVRVDGIVPVGCRCALPAPRGLASAGGLAVAAAGGPPAAAPRPASPRAPRARPRVDGSGTAWLVASRAVITGAVGRASGSPLLSAGVAPGDAAVRTATGLSGA
jgi:hypothetical protein